MKVEPMLIHIPDEDIKDLRKRLENTRWSPPISGSNWEDGTDADYLRDLITYWVTKYDWRKREAELNKLDHNIAEIDNRKIHFIRANGKGSKNIPLLLLHGWPSSFVQIVKIISLLTESRNDGTPSFDVIVASMPGYPFSQFPTQPGMSFAKIAELMTKLMTELGYQKFAARGSDQGALVQQQIGLKYPERLIGIHRSGITPFAFPLPDNLSPAEVEY